MKLRLTPLNIISSVLIVSVAHLFIFADENSWRKLGSIPLILLLLVSFVSDIIFRRLMIDLKRIWLFELLFIIFVAVLILLIKSQFN